MTKPGPKSLNKTKTKKDLEFANKLLEEQADMINKGLDAAVEDKSACHALGYEQGGRLMQERAEKAESLCAKQAKTIEKMRELLEDKQIDSLTKQSETVFPSDGLFPQVLSTGNLQGEKMKPFHGIGNELRRLRLERKLTLRWIAQTAGVGAAYVCDVELGKRSISEHMLKRFCGALGVDVGWNENVRCPSCLGRGWIRIPWPIERTAAKEKSK